MGSLVPWWCGYLVDVLVCCLLIGWLVDGFVRWSRCRFVGWFDCWLVGLVIVLLIGCLLG